MSEFRFSDEVFGDSNVVPVQQEPFRFSDDVFGAAGGSPQKSAAPPAAAASGNWIARGIEAVRGKRDPAYADVPALRLPHSESGAAASRMSQMGAAFAGADDRAYGDILQKSLGGKFLRKFKDANGYDLIDYRADDGSIVRGYVNKPGLDMEDVARGAAGALPFAKAGQAMNGIMKGAPTALRVMGQGGAQAATSVLGDVASMTLGSEQGADSIRSKALMAGIGGALFEAVPGKLMAPVAGAVLGGGATIASSDPTIGEVLGGTAAGAAAGTAANVIARRFLGMTPGAYAKNGKLTPKGEEAARAGGLNPAEMAEDVVTLFANNYAKTRDAAKAAAAADSSFTGIPTTQGQRTRDYAQLVREDQMRAGINGQDAQRVMQEFDTQQKRAIQKQLLGGVEADTSQVPRWQMAGQPPSPVAQKPFGIAPEINPSNWTTRNTGDLGGSIRTGAQTAREGGRQAEREAWKPVGDLHATDDAFKELPAFVGGKLGGMKPDPQLTPAAWKMGEMLEGMIKGEAGKESLAVFGPNATKLTLEETRRRLGAMERAAANDTDRAMARNIRDGFNDWVPEMAKRQLLAGDANAAAQAMAARGVSREVKQIFEPTTQGQKTAGAKALAKVLDDNASPESIVAGLLGDVTVRATPKAGSLEAIRLLKTGLQRYAPAVAKDTMADLSHAHWLRIVTNKAGELAAPAQIVNNWKMAKQNQGSIIAELYSPQVRANIERTMRAIEMASYTPPRFRTNPSGSAFAGGVMVKEALSKLWEALGLNSRLATAAVQTVPGVRQWHGAGAMKATSQTLPEVMPSLGGVGGASGAAYERGF